ncbi:MAG: orotate phosphoribosyltransferase [Candidatus Hydrothermarchaeales archaeon]
MLVDKLKGSVRKGKFVLSSGRQSDYYIDIKRAYTNPGILKEIAKEMAALIKAGETDRIAGIALGAVPLATAISLETGIPFLMIRKEKKGYGTSLVVEGQLETGDRVTVIEDVTTTGASSLAAVEAIRAHNARCDKVLTVVDREEGAKEMLREHGIELDALFKATDLIPAL